jgi:CubicO group peptidase (beta-lactamase class C family)
MTVCDTVENPDLKIDDDLKCHWSRADTRRYGWHHLHELVRFSSSYRAVRVLKLEKHMDLEIAAMESVQRLTSLPWFSAMVVIRGQHVLYEKYAADFGPRATHSVQSISKTLVNLIVGRLVEQGMIELQRCVSHYVPEIDSGYANATVKQLLNMDVVNDYSEDFADPRATYYRHEVAMGWRLGDTGGAATEREFLLGITGADTVNRTGVVQYKDANSALLGWIAERASGKSLRSFLSEIVDAAGVEGVFHMTTDSEGFPNFEGGVCISARDLARYLSIFVRRGLGVSGERVGSEAFIDPPAGAGVAMQYPFDGIRYSNHLMVRGRCVGHGGWGGQYTVAHLDTGTVAVFFSVLENEHALNRDYLGPVVEMLETIVSKVP